MRVYSIIATLLLAGTIQAAALTVCPNGCDYTNIQAAADAANSEDIIEIHSGTYYENLNILNSVATLLGKDVGGGMPIIDARGRGSAITLSAYEFSIAGIYFKNTLFADINASVGNKINLVRPPPKQATLSPLDCMDNSTIPGYPAPGFQTWGCSDGTNEYCGPGVPCIKTKGLLIVDEVMDNPTNRRHLGTLISSTMEDGGGVSIYIKA
jgi:hypothetical protein